MERYFFRKTFHFLQVRVINDRLSSAQVFRLSVAAGIDGSQGPFITLCIPQLKHVQLQIISGVTKPGKRIVIPKQSVIFTGNNERNRHFGVVLVQGLVPSLVIEFIGLVLSQSVERFVIGGFKNLPDRIAPVTFHFNGSKGFSSSRIFLQDHISPLVHKRYFSRDFIDSHHQ